MNRSRFGSIQKVLSQIVVFATLLVIYLATLAPGLTWANGSSDGADLITAAATGGVAHPTGYPLYLVAARLFQLLPVGPLAFRTNLMSAVASSLAAALITGLVMRSISPRKAITAWPAGLAAGFAFGLAPLVWSQAVITEVYALQSLLVVVILQLYTLSLENLNPARVDYWRGLSLGLAMGNHVTSILIVPAALLLGCVRSASKWEDANSSGHIRLGRLQFHMDALRRQLTGLGSGLALYLILPLRAMAQPPVNWGNVTSPERLWWLVSGQLYQSYYLQFNPPELWGRIQSFASLLIEQFSPPGIALALAGLVVFGSGSRLTLLTTWIVFTYTAFAIFYRAVDSYVYLIPVFLCFAIWLGLGLADGMHFLMRWSSPAALVFAFLVIAAIGVRSTSTFYKVDASRDASAQAFGRETLFAAPQNAILFARGDRAVFTLWYFHFALGQRPDLAVVAQDLLHFDWYQENLRSTYPSFAVPGPFPWPETIARENPGRAVCYVQYTDRPEMNCAALGITP